MGQPADNTETSPVYCGRFKRKFIKDLERWHFITPDARLYKSNELMVELVKRQVQAVSQLREKGWTWDEIAGQLGVTRQAAHQFFAPRVDIDQR